MALPPTLMYRSTTMEEPMYPIHAQAGVSLRLGTDDGPASTEQLLEALQLTLRYSVRTSHPLFLNQLYGGPEPAGIVGACGKPCIALLLVYGSYRTCTSSGQPGPKFWPHPPSCLQPEAVCLAGEWLTAVANTNVHTYEVAPVFTLTEVEVLAKFARVVGGAYADCHEGLFVPGGSIANVYGGYTVGALPILVGDNCCALAAPGMPVHTSFPGHHQDAFFFMALSHLMPRTPAHQSHVCSEQACT